MICANCGTQLNEQDTTCYKCGCDTEITQLKNIDESYENEQVFDSSNFVVEDEEILKARKELQDKMNQLNSLIDEENEDISEADEDFLSLEEILNAENLIKELNISEEDIIKASEDSTLDVELALEEDIDYNNNPRYITEENIDEESLEIEEENIEEIESIATGSLEEDIDIAKVIEDFENDEDELLSLEELDAILDESKNRSFKSEQEEIIKSVINDENDEIEEDDLFSLDELDEILKEEERFSLGAEQFLKNEEEFTQELDLEEEFDENEINELDIITDVDTDLEEDSSPSPKKIDLSSLDEVIKSKDREKAPIFIEPSKQKKVVVEEEEEEVIFSLDQLDDIEKILNANKDKNVEITDLDLIQKALIGEEDTSEIVEYDDITDFEGELLAEEEIENLNTKELQERVQNILGEDSEYNENSLISLEVFNKVKKVLVDHEKVEIKPQAERNIDEMELLGNVRKSIQKIKKEQELEEIANDDTGEELLEFERELLASDEEEIFEIKQVEDVDIGELDNLEGMVSFDEIEDEDNILKEELKFDTQTNVDDIVKSILEDGVEFESSRKTSIREEEEFTPYEEIDEEEILENIGKAFGGGESQDESELVEDENEQENESEQEQDEKDLDATDGDGESKEVGKIGLNSKLSSDADLESLEKELISTKIEEDEQEQEEDLTSELTAIEGLLSEVIGEQALIRSIEEDIDFEEDAELNDYEDQMKAMDEVGNNPEHVFEYEALRLDLELFYPGTQDLDNLSRDIERLLAKNTKQLELEMEFNLNSESLKDFEFEELSDKDISDALIEIRGMSGSIDDASEKKAERKRRAKIRRNKIKKILTLGNRVDIFDTFVLFFSLLAGIAVLFAGAKVYQANSLRVSVQTKAERKELGDTIWESIEDVADSFVETQIIVNDYLKGLATEQEALFALSSYINEVVVARENFAKIDFPTYSSFKYEVETFMSERMVLTNAVIKDIEAGKDDTSSIRAFLRLQTNEENLENVKKTFYDLLGI